MPKSKSLGPLGDMIGDVPETPEPVTLESLSRRVGSVESVLATVIEELTDLSEKVLLLSSPPPKAKAKAKGNQPPGTGKPTPTEKPKRKLIQPWDDPEILKDIETCRPKILELLREGAEITKSGCAETLDINASLAGRTLSYMMTQTKEITMISPPATETDPEPKKRFRLKKK